MFDQHNHDEMTAEENEVSLRNYLRVLRKRYHVVLAVFICVFTVILIIALSRTPYYEATTQIFIEKKAPISLITNYGSGSDPHFLQNQFELIKSKGVVCRVVEDTGLAAEYHDQFFPKKNMLLGKWLKSGLSALFRLFVPAGEDKSLTTADASSGATKDEVDRIASVIISGIRVRPVKQTNVVNLSFTHHNPLICKMVVNAVVKAYKEELLEIKMHSSSDALAWMTAKANEEKEKLLQAEHALQKFSREHNLVTIEDKPGSSSQLLTEYGARLSQAKLRRKQLEESYKRLQTLNGDYKALESLPEIDILPQIQQIRQRISGADQHLAELSQKFGAKHPLMIEAMKELEILQEEKRGIIDRHVEVAENEYRTAVNDETHFTQLLEDAKHNALDMNEKIMQHKMLKREVEANRVLYDTLLARIKEIDATDQTSVVNVFVLEKASLPSAPAGPDMAGSIKLAVMLGLISGIGLVLFFEYFDNTVDEVEALESRFRVPVLGVVELFKDTGKRPTEVVDGKSPSSIAEGYRLIRSAIMLSSPGNTPKTLLITSGAAREGKTTTCVNLAKTIALDGKSVMIVDCDLRKPKVHQDFGLSNNEGLSSYLSGMKTKNLLKHVSAHHLSVITAGPVPPNPAELLGSERMDNLLKYLAQKFDYVLLDSPPLLSVADPQVLGSKVDGCLLVVRAKATTYDLLKFTLKKARQVNMNLVGMILNGKDFDEDSCSYAACHYYYATSENRVPRASKKFSFWGRREEV